MRSISKITILAFCAAGILQGSLIDLSYTGFNGSATQSATLYVGAVSDVAFVSHFGVPQTPECGTYCDSTAFADSSFPQGSGFAYTTTHCGPAFSCSTDFGSSGERTSRVILQPGAYLITASISFSGGQPGLQPGKGIAQVDAYAVTGSVSYTPEPSTALLFIPAAVLLWRYRYTQRHHRQRA